MRSNIPVPKCLTSFFPGIKMVNFCVTFMKNLRPLCMLFVVGSAVLLTSG